MGKDDCAANGRSFDGLDDDGEWRPQDGSAKPCPALSAAEAARHLLASVSEGSADRAGAARSGTIGVGRRARITSPTRRSVRESLSETGVARPSSLRKDDPEGVGRPRLPPHGPPPEAVRDLKGGKNNGAGWIFTPRRCHIFF